jgi:DNA polymerase-3 subunit delta'
VGKATFAYRAARRLLGARADPSHGLLGADPADPVARQIAARAHPDLLVLERDAEGAGPRKSIPVDEARQLPEFFSKSPANAAYRVAIVDAADDLNVNAANAVLKTLEEPPPKGVLLLVSHRPGALLPTLRSRCRRLAFAPPPEPETAPWLMAQTGLSLETAQTLLAIARGAPGRALRLAQAGALEIDAAAQALVAGLRREDESKALALAESFRGAEGAARFALLMERLAAALRERAAAAAPDRLEEAARWAQAWERVSRLPSEVEGLNLDRGDAFFTALAELRDLARC